MKQGSTIRVAMALVLLVVIIYFTATQYNNKWIGIILAIIVANSLGREGKIWLENRKKPELDDIGE